MSEQSNATAEPVATSPRPRGELKYVTTALIRENAEAIRLIHREDPAYKELVDSVRKNGIMDALLVRERDTLGTGDKAIKDGKKYEVISGHHRLAAAREVGLDEVPVQVTTIEESDNVLKQLQGNLHKIEMKHGEYQRTLMTILASNPTMTKAELAAAISRSPQFVEDRLALGKLNSDIKDLVNDGSISLSNAVSLSKLPADEQPNYVQDAIRMKADEFGAKVLEKKKAIDQARKQGKAESEVEFKPQPVLRAWKDIKAEHEGRTVGKAMLAANGIDPTDANLKIWNLAIDWTASMDPQSQKAAIDKHEADKKKKEDEKAKRQAEREQKKAKEEADKKAQADREAELARQELEKMRAKAASDSKTAAAGNQGAPVNAPEKAAPAKTAAATK